MISPAFAGSLLALSVAVAPPDSAKRPVVDTLHGVKITDDYRWLEDWNDPAVQAWSNAQNAHARSVLDALPSVDAIRGRVTKLLTEASIGYGSLACRADKVFAIKHDPKKQQAMLVVMPSPDHPEQERIILDPNALDAKGLTAIDWYIPSHNGLFVAVSMSEGGSESGNVHVYDVATGKETGDVIARVNGGTAGGSLAWAPDDKSFYYTRYPRKGERPEEDLDFYMQVFSHTLGQPDSQDAYEVGKEFPKIAEIMLDCDKASGAVVATVQKGDGGEFMHWVKNKDGWYQHAGWNEKVVQYIIRGPMTYAVSRAKSPKGGVTAVGRMDDKRPGIPFVGLIPATANSIDTDFSAAKGISVAGGRLFVLYQAGGPSELEMFDLQCKPLGKVELPPVCSVEQVVDYGAEALIQVQTFLSPPAWYRVDASGKLTKTALAETSPVDLSNLEVVREFATSKDGTKVPLSIIRPKGLGHGVDNGITPSNGAARTLSAHQLGADGKPGWDLPSPTIVWGYGGYGVNESPTFSPRRAVFLEQGGVFVVANIRGGGEYGEEWHRAGNLTNKQNVFDDFYAAAQHMIARGYSDKEHLGLFGGSNGGLLMGATFTQHADLAKCVVSSVGIYDMLRVELSANGAFNVTEFGTVQNKPQFDALYAYSPYHHVTDGTTYPDILFLTGANDPRVDPMQSRKMTARLQTASPKSLTLLRTSANSGHGIGSSLAQRIEETVDIYAFFMQRLGMKYQAIK